jgi:hypothetical protein
VSHVKERDFGDDERLARAGKVPRVVSRKCIRNGNETKEYGSWGEEFFFG